MGYLAHFVQNDVEHDPMLDGPTLKQRGKICEVRVKNCLMLSNVFRSACFMTKQKEIVKMKSAIRNENGEIMILGKPVAFKDDFFV